MQKTFYYNFDWFNGWFALNTALLVVIIWSLVQCPCFFCVPQAGVLLAVFLVSIAFWSYKYLLKHRMALVTDEYIKIDNCAPLNWKDIIGAEERIIKCCGKQRKIIVLIPKKDIEYKYNFLQRHNGEFTPFSIPLYGILSAEDEKELTQIVSKKVKLKKIKG